MTEANGSHVTRAELAAHIKGIDQRFQDVAVDIAEIKWGIHGITETLGREKAELATFRRGFLRAWAPPLISAGVAATVSLAAALILH